MSSEVVGGGAGQVIELIRERAHGYYPELNNSSQVRLTATQHRAYSTVYRVTIENKRQRPRTLIVKVFPAAHTQFNALRRVWPSFAPHSRWKIPRPLDVLEEGPALVMEAAAGHSLQQTLPWLWWRGSAVDTALTHCRAAGQWLRFYHDLGRAPQPTMLDLDAKSKELQRTLMTLIDVGFDRRRIREIPARLAALEHRLRGHRLPASHVHGEFTIDNILVNGDSLTGIDLRGWDRNAIHHDLASFSNSLFLLRLTRPAPWLVLAQLRRAFLESYFGGTSSDDVATSFLQVTGLADSVAEICTRRRSRLARSRLQYVFLHVVDALVSDKEGAN